MNLSRHFKLLCLASVILLFLGCGKAEFAGRTEPTAPTDIPIFLTGTDYYVEIGQEFSGEMTGDVVLTNVLMFAKALWTGSNNIQFEMRVALTGTAAPNTVVIKGTSAPSGWTSATQIFNQNVTGGSTVNEMQSGNLSDVFTDILEQKNFWILIRLRAQGADSNKTLTLRDIQAFAEGYKSLESLAPLINLTH